MNIQKKILYIFNRPQNIFVTFLRLLNVKCTNWYSNQFYNDYPDKYNFYGLSRMLAEYNVKNVGIRVKDKKQSLTVLDTPFIAHVGNDFVVVNKMTGDRVYYLWHDKQISIVLDKFLNIWSGSVLIADVDENSGEPNYESNRKQELFVFLERGVIVFAIIYMLFYFYNIYGGEIAFGLLLLMNFIGGIVSGLLLLKQLKIQGKYIDNICSLLLPHSDCNSILEGKATKLFNILSWSEIGFGYFVSNIFIMLFLPDLFLVIPVLNIFTLPFTFWSVWYQKFVAKQWCALCLVVQCILWSIFFVNLFFGLFLFIDNWLGLLFVCNLYMLIVLSINLSARFLSNMIKNENVSYELKSLKSNKDVFLFLLKKGVYCDFYKLSSNILFGDLQSVNMITVITNPHCNPCAMMHKRINSMINSNKCCIQYVFTSFSEELDESCLFLIALYQQRTIGDFTKILTEWFEFGKFDSGSFYQRYPVNITTDMVLGEYDKHKKMINMLNVVSTPTILFNGYRLPEFYKIEDLGYFSNVKF